MNTGNEPVFSSNRMLTTLCYQLGPNEKPFYALEGSIEMGGASIMWAKKSLQLFNTYDELNSIASGVKDSGDVYFIPGMVWLIEISV